jgi:uncharacterized membrane protein
MERRYVALRTVGTIYRVLGIIIGCITVLAVIAVCISSVIGGGMMNSLGSQSNYAGASLLGGVFGGLLMSFFFLLYGGVMALTLFAAGEGVYLLIALEENTRVTAELLQQKR